MSLDLNDVVDNDWLPPFSKKEFERRYKLVRKGMKENGLDCLVIYGAHAYMGTDLGQTNAVYLANYAGFGHIYVVVPLEEEPTLFVPIFPHIPNARALSPIKDIRGGMDIERGVGDRLKELGLEKGNIGIVGPWGTWWNFSIPVEHDNYFRQTFPKASFRLVTELYEEWRLIKSEEEIAHMERAAAINDVAQEEIVLATKPGVRHSELSNIAHSVAARLGGNIPFLHISSNPMANPQMMYPDPYPTHAVVKAGDYVMAEFPMGYGGYYSRLMHIWFVGEPTKEYLKLFEVAASVYEGALKGLKPGMTVKDAGKFMEPIPKAGFTSMLPLLSGWSTYNHKPTAGFLPGMEVVAKNLKVEPDFVFKPNLPVSLGGSCMTPDLSRLVWVCSNCVFTKDGIRSLHKYPVNKLRVV